MRRWAVAGVMLLVSAGLVSAPETARSTPAKPTANPPRAAGQPRAPLRAVPGAQPDFDGDGFADLALWGMHYADTQNLPHWAVNIVYGSSKGLARSGNQVWRQLDFADEAAPLRLVGDTATGDFDDDGFADLAIGLYPSDPEIVPQTGAVRVLYGSPTGLQRRRSQLWTATSPGLPTFRGADNASFGSTLAAADFGRTGHADLAIGAYERDGGGAVTVLYGSDPGLTAAGSQLWSQATAGIPGSPGPMDQFGAELAAGYLTGGPFADLAVGVPGDGGSGDEEGPGAVNVIYGSVGGLTARGSQLWSQGSRGIKGKPVAGEQFGDSLAVGNFGGRTADDLAVGVRAATDAREYGGAVNVIYGSGSGLSAKGDQLWTPRSRGLKGKKHLDLFFGSGLVAGNFGRDVSGRGYDDLAISAATEYEIDDEYGTAGAVEVIYGSTKGLAAKHSQIWRWHSPGIKGNPPIDNDGYGDALIAADFGNGMGKQPYVDLAVGDTMFSTNGRTYGAVSVMAGSRKGLTARGDQLWTIQKLKRNAPTFLLQ